MNSLEVVYLVTSGVKQNQHFVRTGKHGPGRLAVTSGTMNAAVSLNILEENVRPSVPGLKMKRTWVLQWKHDSKYT